MSARLKTYMSAMALIMIHTSINVVYKTSQIKGGGYSFSSSGSLVVSELVKLCISIMGIHHFDTPQEKALFFAYLPTAAKSYLPFPGLARVPNTAGRQGLIRAVFGLAALYAMNNNLAFRLFTLADPATISLFKSMTSFTTAIVMFLFLRRPIWRVQWFAVLFQCAGLVVFQYDPCKGTPIYSFSTYLLLFTAVMITTVSSVWNDHVLKSSDLSLNGVNALLYFFGACLNLLFFLREHALGGPGFFDGYTTQAMLVIFFNSIIGIAVTLVYKFGDALVKTFASAITAVLLLIISSMFFGLQANIVTWTGGLITVLATYMYLSEKGLQVPQAQAPNPTLANLRATGLTGSSPNLNLLGDSGKGKNGPGFQNLVYLMGGVFTGMLIVYAQLPDSLPTP